MAARTFVGFRVGASLQLIKQWADKETGGNISEMIRKLLGEAITARLKLSK